MYLAGQAPTDAAGRTVGSDVETQAEACFRKLSLLLGEVSAGLDAIVMMNVYLRNMDDLGAVTAVQQRLFTQPYPAMSMYEVSRLVNPDWLIEIDAIAAID